MEDEEPLVPAEDPPDPPEPPGSPWRIGAAFWLLGLCNNLPYVLLLSVARDLLEPRGGSAVLLLPSNGSHYECSRISTGAVLLADILPTLLIKLVAPFVVHLLPYKERVIVAAFCAWGSVTALLSARGVGLSLGGVALASAASGLGEVTFLGLAAKYPSAALSGWSSGSGGAGLAGAGLPLLLRPLPLPPALPALPLPLLSLASYFFLLVPPPPAPPPPAEPRPLQRWGVVKAVLPQAGPLALVYFMEYFINQGLLDLLYFPASALSHNDQYRWAQLLYQAGVFVSRSSPRCLRLHRLAGLALLQTLIAALLLAAVLGLPLPGLAAALALVLGEGLVGGGAYGNAVLNVAEQAPPPGAALAMAVTALGASLGVALAGGAALGLHGLLCPTARPTA